MSDSILIKIKNMITRGDVDYFQMFVEGAEISLKAALALQVAFADEQINEAELDKIKEIEHEGDRHVHKSIAILEDAFITPIDQTELLDILKGIEEVTDHIDDVASHCYMLHIDQTDIYIEGFMKTMVEACQKQVQLMEYLRNFKKLKFKEMNTLIAEINALEEAADRIYLTGMRKLFSEEKNAITIIRKQGIYSRLEDVLDSIEDVSDVIKKVLVSKL
ncbi:MAG: DUF47 family protein [Erysipelotrichaceae bacterium]